MIFSDRVLLHTEFVIDSAHKLNNYDGKCSNVHGHTWLLEVWIRGEQNPFTNTTNSKNGILFDFGNVKNIKEEMDHKFLNDLPFFEDNKINPSAENISFFVLTELKKINPNLEYCVKVHETAIGKSTYCVRGDFHAI